MHPIVETLGVILLALLGAFAGRMCWRLPLKWLPVCAGLPLGFLVCVAIAGHAPAFSYVPPMSWVIRGRLESVLMGPAITFMFVSQFPRIATLKAMHGFRRIKPLRLKIFLIIFMSLTTLHFSVMPFLMPYIVRDRLAAIITETTPDGICLQKTCYTCGPASAVTALRRLGLDADEGEMAMLAHTSPSTGTSDSNLAAAIEEKYGAQGVRAERRFFGSIDNMAVPGQIITTIKWKMFVDHWVAMLEVGEDEVVIGDPIRGRFPMKREKFEEVWRRHGMVISKREGPGL
jgi:predicted double-glycine peptidase